MAKMTKTQRDEIISAVRGVVPGVERLAILPGAKPKTVVALESNGWAERGADGVLRVTVEGIRASRYMDWLHQQARDDERDGILAGRR